MKKIEINFDSFMHKYEASCGGGACPKIFIDDNGDALVQGYLVDDTTKIKMNLNDDEDVVFVPKSIIQELIKQIK